MKKLILFVLLVLNFTTIGQCPPAEKFVRNKDEKGSYIQNSQSRSAYLRSGEIFETSFICQGGYDYRFTIGTEKKTSGNLKYEVYEMEVNRVQENGKSVYRKEKRVLYSSLDNTSISIMRSSKE